MEPDVSSSIWKKAIRYATLTDIGLRRANNQDSHASKPAVTARQWFDRGHFFIVADGMGAHAAGEVASQLAAEAVMQGYLKRSGESAPQALVNAVYDAHRVLREKSRREDAFRDMGTTCDAFALLPAGIIVAHVGDSRVYRVRGPVIEQLTFDHSLVWEVCLATNLPFDQAPNYIPKNQITRSLGPTEKLIVDLEGPFPIQVGDTFLACSDGLTGQVSDREIGEILNVFPPEPAVETLINLANLRGGPDNITVIVVQATQSPTTDEEVAEELKIPLSSWGLLAAMVACGLGIGAGFVLGNMAIAASAAVASVVAGFLFFRYAAKSIFGGSPFETPTHPFGRGPYTKSVCAPSQDFAENYEKIYKELRQATQGNQLSVKSPDADQCEKTAKTAMKSRDYTGAIRQYALAVNHLMRELKKLSTKKK